MYTSPLRYIYQTFSRILTVNPYSLDSNTLMEHFQWLTNEDSILRMNNPEFKDAVSDEIADVMIYMLAFANATGVDIGKAVVKKMDNNKFRFPFDHILDQ